MTLRAECPEEVAYFVMEQYNECQCTHAHQLVENGAEQSHVQHFRHEYPRKQEHENAEEDILGT